MTVNLKINLESEYPGEPKTKSILIRLTPAEYKNLRIHCFKLDISVQALIRKTIRQMTEVK